MSRNAEYLDLLDRIVCAEEDGDEVELEELYHELNEFVETE